MMFTTQPIEEPDPDYDCEAGEAYYWRYKEAKKAGLTMLERRLFAESNADIGKLRDLVEKGCPPELIAKIVL